MKKIINRLVLVLALIIGIGCTSRPLDRIQASYRPMVQQALQKAGENQPELEKFIKACSDEELEGAAFLLSNMPLGDLTSLKAPFLLENIHYAYLARKQVNWGNRLPDSIFLNYVLPYANIHERRDNWRKDFYQKFFHLIKGAQTPGQAAVILNRNIWNMINVHYSTKRPKADQSPYESIEAGLASCTGLSILLVDACRAVGIPARLTGVPMWYNNSGNHSWVEIWDNGWHFLESASDDTLDKAWFEENASHANHSDWQYGIYAISYKKTGRHYHNIFNPNADYFWAIDVTDRYARKVKMQKSVTLKIKVVDEEGGERIRAKVQLWDGNKMIADGFSRNERNDVNDVLTFKVQPRHHYIVLVEYRGKIIKRELQTEQKSEQIIVLKLRKE